MEVAMVQASSLGLGPWLCHFVFSKMGRQQQGIWNSSRIGLQQNRLFFFYFCFRCRAAIVGLVLVVVMLHWSGIANGKTLSSISISYYECQNCSVALQFTVLNCILNDHVFGGVEVSLGWNVKEGIRGGGLVYFGKSMSSPDFSNTTGNERV